MKFPSLHLLRTQLFEAILRFPLTVLLAIIGTCTASYLFEQKYDNDNVFLTKILVLCGLGLSLSLAVDLFMESKNPSKIVFWLGRLGVILFLVGYFFTLPSDVDFISGTRTFLLALTAHLMVSFAPFLYQNTTEEFWSFNKTLFIRIILSGLYSGVLYVGIAIAIVAVDNLFNVEFRKIYGHIFFFLAGIFNTLFFLAGVPRGFTERETEQTYPREIKIFTQFVLLPLVTIYLTILYAYSSKILLEWSLPRGWVSYLVLSFSIAGILSLLLIYPVRNMEGNSWIKIFSKGFYLALFPLVILLFLAIGTRISAYGITEERYWVLVLGSWLLAMAGYFIFSKEKNIKVIPITLALIAFLSSFGVWGAYSVASRSQKAQLEALFAKNKLLKNGMFDNALSVVLKDKDENRVRSIVDFFAERNNIEALQPIFTKKIVYETKKRSHYENKNSQKNAIYEITGMENLKSEVYNSTDEQQYQYFNNLNKVVSIKGYDYMVSGGMYGQKTTLKSNIEVELVTLETTKNTKYKFLVDKKSIEMDFEPYFKKLLKNAKINQDSTEANKALPTDEEFYFENEHLKVKIIITNLSIVYDKKQNFVRTNNLDFDLLFNIK